MDAEIKVIRCRAESSSMQPEIQHNIKNTILKQRFQAENQAWSLRLNSR